MNDMAANLMQLRDSIKKLERFPIFIIVEDDVDDAEFLTKQVRLYFKRCYTMVCETGDEALKLLKEVKADAVFLDLKLPQTDVFKFMGMVRDEFKTLVVIVVTGSKDNAELILEVLKAGAAKILIKPVNQQDLHATFGTLC